MILNGIITCADISVNSQAFLEFKSRREASKSLMNQFDFLKEL